MEEKGSVTSPTTGSPQVAEARLPAFGHLPFGGNYTTKLEPNGRLVLPSAFKSAFGGQARLRAHKDEHLMLWTEQAFKLVADQIEEQAKSVAAVRSIKRFHQSVETVHVDRQSRLVVPPALREMVGLGEQVVLAGSVETVEIWDAQRYEDEVRASLADADLFFDTFDGLSRDPE